MNHSTALNGPKKVNAIFRNHLSSGGRLGMRSSPSRAAERVRKAWSSVKREILLAGVQSIFPPQCFDPTDARIPYDLEILGAVASRCGTPSSVVVA